MPNVLFRSSDNELIPIDIEVAKNMSTVINGVLMQVMEGYEHEIDKEHVVPFPYTPANVLRLIVEWSTYHHHNDPPVVNENIQPYREANTVTWVQWDRDFINRNDNTILALVGKTASFLKMTDLQQAMRIAIRRHLYHHYH